MELTAKLKLLEKIIGREEKIMVCFSGGVDSSLLLFLCVKYLGPENVVALTLHSEASPPGEIDHCRSFAHRFGVEHLVLEYDILQIAEVASGDARRCYFCKKGICLMARQEADKRNIETIYEGSNCDDLSDYRPGYEAIKEYSLTSPFLEAKLNKQDIREASRTFHLPTAERPALACLVTRFPYGTRITHEELRRVNACEAYLLGLGFQNFRVRCHGETARLEVAPVDINRFCDPALRQKIVAHFKKEGFAFVALDLEGYRTGSLNRSLKGLKKTL
ncbi:MAG: ATP-dependent sacrificial sulfur transferase LarE [Deltaproteobacteria bacterium]|nr:ATP-dependent sacrificial sulfur transferase LarE [Deltaproteobacteria bacterium]